MAVDSIEVLARLEGSSAQVSDRLDLIEHRLGRVEERIDGARVKLLQRMDRQFYGIFGLLAISILGSVFSRLFDL